MKPRKLCPSTSADPWYTAVPLGHNILDRYLKNILDAARISSVNKSNHSLRATAISRLQEKKVPEKLVMERSGHLTRERLQPYERTSVAQFKAVSSALSESTELPTTEPSVPDVPGEPSRSTSEPGEMKQDVARELLRNLQFHNLSGCTFNINMHT